VLLACAVAVPGVKAIPLVAALAKSKCMDCSMGAVWAGLCYYLYSCCAWCMWFAAVYSLV